MRILILLACLRAVLAATVTSKTTSYSSSTACSTVYKKKSTSSIKTTYTTTTLAPENVIFTTTSTPYTTITPSPTLAYTTNTVSTTTVDTLPTSIQSFTKTKQITITATLESTAVVTTTTGATSYTTVTSTVQIPAPSGFLPMNDTLTALYGNAAPNAAQPQGTAAASTAIDRSLLKSMYEVEVQCTNRIQPTYITAIVDILPTQKTTLAPSTSTSTILVTITITLSTTPLSKTTSTSLITKHTSTTSITGTTTSTTTLTSTTVLTDSATATHYAACSANNIINEFGWLILFAWGYTLTNSNNTYAIQSSSSSAYNCCVACQLAAGTCQFSEYVDYAVPNGQLGDGTCTMFMADGAGLSNGTCVRGQPEVARVFGLVGEPYYEFYSNGPCGRVGYAGSAE